MVLHALFGLAEVKFLETKIMAARTASNLVMCRQVRAVIRLFNGHSFLFFNCSVDTADNKKFKKDIFVCTYYISSVDRNRRVYTKTNS